MSDPGEGYIVLTDYCESENRVVPLLLGECAE